MRIVIRSRQKPPPASMADTHPHSYSAYKGDTQPIRVRPRRRTGLRFLTGLIGAFALALGATTIVYAADAMYAAPWAYPILGRPTLTGNWQGTFTTPSGVKFAVFLDLHRPMLASGPALLENYRGALLSGTANWCDSQGRLAKYLPVTGAVPTASGSNGTADRVEIDMDYGSSPAAGLLLMSLRGKWSGDSLVVKPMFGAWNGQTLVYSADSPDIGAQVEVTLKKVQADAFPQACGTLLDAAP